MERRETQNDVNKVNTKPFTFRWEINHFYFLRMAPDEAYCSREFEVGDGVQMFVQICKYKGQDGNDYLGVHLCKAPGGAKKVKLIFSITLVNNVMTKNHTLREPSPHVFTNERKRDKWGWSRAIQYQMAANYIWGFLKDGHMLTVIVEGAAFINDEIENIVPFDQALTDKLCYDLGKLFDGGAFSDFVVKAKDSDGKWKEFKVHTLILKARSEVFAAMLSNPDLKECREGVLEVEDIDSGVMEALLRFLYTGVVPALETEIHDLLYLLVAADKYMIMQLKSRLERVLAAKLSNDEIYCVLGFAERHMAPFLVARCWDFIEKYMQQL